MHIKDKINQNKKILNYCKRKTQMAAMLNLEAILNFWPHFYLTLFFKDMQKLRVTMFRSSVITRGKLNQRNKNAILNLGAILNF
jgi:hypothetical protein